MSTRTTSPPHPAATPAGQAERPSPRQRVRTPRRSTPRTTVIATLTALLLGALLNGPGLVSAATSLDVGATRTVAMRLATLVESTGAALHLDRPHRWVDDLRNQGLETIGATASGDAPVGAGNSSPPPAPEKDPQPTADVSVQEHDRTRRPPSADEPVEVLLVGDSLIGAIADGFGRVTDGWETVSWTKDVRISTGLARPDVLDWHHHLEQQLAEHDPDMVVLMIGGNDDQSLTGAPGGVIHLGQEGWEPEYERRVAELLSIAARGDRLVVWLGLPAMLPDRLERTRATMQTAAERAIADTEVVLLDTESVVSPNGYASRLDGVRVRADDGVHLTHAGGDRIAALLEQVLRGRHDLPGD